MKRDMRSLIVLAIVVVLIVGSIGWMMAGSKVKQATGITGPSGQIPEAAR